MRKIIVSGHCQTQAMAGALGAIFPEDRFTGVPVPFELDSAPEAAAEADLWLTMTVDRAHKALAARLNPRLAIMKFPAIMFRGFHPDICYAGSASTGEPSPLRYDSAIAAWCYNRGVDAADAARLFRWEVFASLGYLSDWEPAAQSQKWYFTHSDFPEDFDRFFVRAMDCGPFMHTINHPKTSAINVLARIIAQRLGADGPALARELPLEGTPPEDVWPVYPAVAAVLGMPDLGYRWKVGETACEGLGSYLEFAYRSYEGQGLRPGDLHFKPEFCAKPFFDRVLTEALAAGALPAPLLERGRSSPAPRACLQAAA